MKIAEEKKQPTLFSAQELRQATLGINLWKSYSEC